MKVNNIFDKKFEKYKEKTIYEFLEQYGNSVESLHDLTSDKEPTNLFYVWLKLFGYLMSNDPEECVSKKGIDRRKAVSPLLHKLAPSTLSNPQVFEDRNLLMYGDNLYVKMDDKKIKEYSKEIVLPEEPVIWVANHAFKDDTLASILAQTRQASILFGSLPQFYNTMDGLTGWIIGVSMVNRNCKDSRHSSLEKAKKIIDNGGDMFMFPEGAWNRTQNRLMVDLWPGFYKLAKETGAKVVPISHYISDTAALGNKEIKIHTVVDDPIRIDNLEEEEAITLVRDTISTWYYLMMERYGQSTREEELKGFNSSNEAWRDKIARRIDTVDYYDIPLENTVSYRQKNIVRPEDVWEPIINTKDPNKEYAKQLVKTRKESDFQNNF